MSGIQQLILGAIQFIDQSQYAPIAHISSYTRDIIAQQRHERETIFEAVERAACESRATLLEQNATILANFPKIRGRAVVWAYLHDDVDALRASCIFARDSDIVRELIENMVHVPYDVPGTDDVLAYTHVRSCGVETLTTLKNTAQVLSPKCVSFIDTRADIRYLIHPTIARISRHGDLIYVRNDERLVDMIYAIFGVDAIRAYISEYDMLSACTTNLCERSYMIRAVLRNASRETIEWVSNIMNCMDLVPTDTKNAQVIGEILHMIGDHTLTMKLLRGYLRSSFFSREMLYDMARNISCDTIIRDSMFSSECGIDDTITCMSIGMISRMVCKGRIDADMSDTLIRICDSGRDTSLIKTMLSYIPAATIVAFSSLTRLAIKDGCSGTIERVAKHSRYLARERAKMRPKTFEVCHENQFQHTTIIAQLVGNRYMPDDDDEYEYEDAIYVPQRASASHPMQW